MNAYIVYQNKKPFLRKIPIPFSKQKTLPHGKLLIQIHYASLNPADYKTADGEHDRLINFQYPRVLGFDFAGKVVKTCENSKFQVGDAVFGMIQGLPNYQTGTLAEFTLIDESICSKCPSSLSFKECAAIPLVGITSIKALDICRLEKGERILILGGSGGVGTMAIQLAKHVYKASHITTTASTPQKISACYKLGADLVMNYKSMDYLQILFQQKQQFDVILDCVGSASRAMKLLAPKGRLCSIVVSPTSHAIRQWVFEQKMENQLKCCLYKIIWSEWGAYLLEFFNGAKTLKSNGIYHHVIGGGNGVIMKRLFNYLETKKIKPVIGKELTLNEIEHGFQLLRNGGVLGKIVISVLNQRSLSLKDDIKSVGKTRIPIINTKPM